MSDRDGVRLGFDLGTQSARVYAIAGGRVLARSAVALTSRRTSGERPTHEQDPADWWSAFVRAAQVVCREIDPSEISGIAGCGTSGTVAFMRWPDGQFAGPALMYDDGRAREEADRLGVSVSWGLPKALWLYERFGRRESSDVRLVHQVDVVTSRLVGSPVATDWSSALKSGVDVAAGAWPASYPLPERCLPPVVAPGTLLGAVGPDAAAETGIPAGTPVLAGLTDGCAAQVAAGALEVGAWNYVLGTTLVLKGCTTSRLIDPTGGIYSHRSPDGTWWPGGASSTGAGALASFSGDLTELDRAAAEREPAACLAYPLVGRGERFPFANPDAEGFVVGPHAFDELDRYAAVLQGVAFVARLGLEHVERLGAPVSGPVSLTGGGARSAYWCRLVADILGREVVVPAHPEGAYGMAIVAASHAYGSLAEAAKDLVQVGERYAPSEGAAERWVKPYDRWIGELVRRGWVQRAG